MKQTVKVLFRGATAVFYAICRLAWAMYFDNLQAFTNFSDQYDEQYGLDALAAVLAAEDMADESTRQGNLNSMTEDLQVLADLCIDNFLALMRYIDKAFTTGQAAAMKQVAGEDYFASAEKGNMNDLTSMMNSSAAFVKDYTDTLLKGGKGMPKAFPDVLAKNKTSFNDLLDKYNRAKKNTGTATGDKRLANNAVYLVLESMLDDAQIIFRKNKDLQKAFTYNILKKIVSPGVKTGIHFSLKDKATGKPVGLALISIQAAKVSRKAKKSGVLDVRLAKGTYTVVVTLAGYETYTGQVTVDTGVMHRENIMLTKAV